MISKLSLRSVPTLIAVALLPPILSACSPGKLPALSLKRELPPAPEWAKPIAPPKHKPGDDWQVIAKREGNRGDQQADITACFRAWYENGVRKAYAEGKPLAEADALAAKQCADVATKPRAAAPATKSAPRPCRGRLLDRLLRCSPQPSIGIEGTQATP